MSSLEKVLSYMAILIAAGLILRSRGAFNSVLLTTGNNVTQLTQTLQDRSGSV